MWFAKWFGGRDEQLDDTDEPARHVAPAVWKAAPTPARVVPANAGKPARKGAGKGFDPYNSGSFERRNAWERITRR